MVWDMVVYPFTFPGYPWGHLGTIWHHPTEAFGANASDKLYDFRGETAWSLASLTRSAGVFRHLRGMAAFFGWMDMMIWWMEVCCCVFWWGGKGGVFFSQTCFGKVRERDVFFSSRWLVWPFAPPVVILHFVHSVFTFTCCIVVEATWSNLNICFYLRNLCIPQREDEPPSKLPLHSPFRLIW